MPIRPENKNRYPKEWPQISKAVRDRANNRCEACGVENGRMIYRGSHDGRAAWRYSNDSAHTESRCAYEAVSLPGTSWDDFERRTSEPVKVVLTVAHLDHHPENCEDNNLRAWCQRCHNAYDAKTRAAGVILRRRSLLVIADLFGPTE